MEVLLGFRVYAVRAKGGFLRGGNEKRGAWEGLGDYSSERSGWKVLDLLTVHLSGN